MFVVNESYQVKINDVIFKQGKTLPQIRDYSHLIALGIVKISPDPDHLFPANEPSIVSVTRSKIAKFRIEAEEKKKSKPKKKKALKPKLKTKPKAEYKDFWGATGG